MTPGALSPYRDEQAGTIRYPLGTQLQGGGGWRLGLAPGHRHGPRLQRLFLFSFSLGKSCGGRSKPQLVFIASRLKKGLSIFLERRGKKNIFFPDPRGGLVPIFHLLSLLGGADWEVSLQEDPEDDGS